MSRILVTSSGTAPADPDAIAAALTKVWRIGTILETAADDGPAAALASRCWRSWGGPARDRELLGAPPLNHTTPATTPTATAAGSIGDRAGDAAMLAAQMLAARDVRGIILFTTGTDGAAVDENLLAALGELAGVRVWVVRVGSSA